MQGSIKFASLEILMGIVDEPWPVFSILSDTDGEITISLGDRLEYENEDHNLVLEKDYHVGGEIWQVHKYDADPFPSRPHAHCIGGRTRFIGLKLHLGNRGLYDGPHFANRYLPKKPFLRLIELIQPKFPLLVLPLAE